MYKKIVLFTAIFLLVFIGWFAWAVYNDKPPQFFPFDEKKGYYEVIKVQTQNYDLKRNHSIFKVRYTGPGIFKGLGVERTSVDVPVGKTNYKLADFTYKPVILKKGEFVYSTKQCVQKMCQNLGGNNIVVNIDELILK